MPESQKKVGIVSLFAGQNFGNKLQNYAVETIVKKYGFLPETFTYEFNKNSKPVTVSLKDKLKPGYILSYIKLILQKKIPLKNSDSSFAYKVIWKLKNSGKTENAEKLRVEKYRNFDEKYLNFSKRVISTNEKNATWSEEYHRFICGSDQVWNPYYPSTSGICFLQFVPEEKRIAFAPSFGVSRLPEERMTDYKKWIQEIPNLSVREEAGQKIIKEITGRDASVIADPTTYLDVDDWRQFETEPSFKLPKKYALTYFLGDRTKEYSKYIKKMTDEQGLETVDLFDLMKPEYYSCSPDEFMYCIDHASAVFTDSFHASVFSIIFEKPFMVFERKEGGKSMSSRIATLLHKFNLEDNMYNGSNAKNCFKTDFSKCKDILEAERKKTDEFLVNSFS